MPLVFIDPTRFQRGVFAQEKAVARCAGRADTRRSATRTSYVLEVTRSAAQASEVVRAAWSSYKGKDNPDLRLLDLDKVAALIEADFPTQAVLRAAAQQPVRHAREPGGAARSAARVLLGRHRRLLPGDEAHRPRRRRRDVRPQRVRPARAGEHEPGHRPRHRAGELRDRQRREGRPVRQAAEPHQPGARRQPREHHRLPPGLRHADRRSGWAPTPRRCWGRSSRRWGCSAA